MAAGTPPKSWRVRPAGVFRRIRPSGSDSLEFPNFGLLFGHLAGTVTIGVGKRATHFT